MRRLFSSNSTKLLANDSANYLFQVAALNLFAQRVIDERLVAACHFIDQLAKVVEASVVEPDSDPRFSCLRRNDEPAPASAKSHSTLKFSAISSLALWSFRTDDSCSLLPELRRRSETLDAQLGAPGFEVIARRAAVSQVLETLLERNGIDQGRELSEQERFFAPLA